MVHGVGSRFPKCYSLRFSARFVNDDFTQCWRDQIVGQTWVSSAIHRIECSPGGNRYFAMNYPLLDSI